MKIKLELKVIRRLRMKEVVISVDERIVSDVQLKDITVQSLQSIVMSFMEMHALDSKDTVLNSPVFLGMQKKVIDARRDFENAKDAMITQVVPEDTRKKVTSWNLAYNRCELILCVEE